MCSTDTGPVPGFAGTRLTGDQLTGEQPFDDGIPLEPVDSVTVTTLIDNIADLTAPDTGPATRPSLSDVGEARVDDALFTGNWAVEGLVAEHGFSALVTVTKNGTDRHLLFDAGLSPHALSTNMRILGVDPGGIETIVLSHGHFDHTSGLAGFVRDVGQVNVPVVIHPEFWSRRRLVIPGKDPVELPTASRRSLEETGFTIVEDRQPSFLLDNSVLITGEVDRTSGFEPGFPPQQAWRNGGWEPDPLVLDDQALIVNVRGKGLVILTGCGHAGIVNITRYAKRLTGTDTVHAVMGGFHLGGPLFEPLIPRVCDALAAFSPDVIVPAHCTGWNAQRALAGRFPSAFIPNTVGSRYLL